MPPGYRTILAKKYNICEKYIDYIFRGERNRPDIVDEAINMAKEYQDYLKAQSEKIKTIINTAICITLLFALSGCRISDNLEKLYVRAKISDPVASVRTKSEVNSFSNSTIGVFVDDEDGFYSPVTNSTAVVTSGSVTAAPSPDIYINTPAKVYAYYPASSNELENPTSASTIAVNIQPDMPMEQQIDYLWADPADVSRPNNINVPLTFHHALAKIVFSIKLTDSYDGSTTLSSLRLISNSSYPIFKSGIGTMSIADGIINLLEGSGFWELSFCPENQTLSSTDELEIITLAAPNRLANSTSDDSSIDLFLSAGQNTYQAILPVNPVAEWVGGTVYKYNITLGGVDMIINGVTATPWVDETDIDVEVSTTTATANCYILAPDDVLTIPVNIKGNGGDAAETGVSVTHHAESVGILWQTLTTNPLEIKLIYLENFDETNQTVDIRSNNNGETGNAVIAAYSGPDRTGDILWSWHIWVTDYDPDVPSNGTTYGHTNSTGVFNEFMDRNLGATSSTPGTVNTYGLMYQWGRKDPFVNSNNYSSASQDLPVDGTPISKIAGSVTLSTSISHPTNFYYNTVSPYDWLSTPNDELWGGLLYGQIKTIFDPCPAGWRVPNTTKLSSVESPCEGITYWNWNINGQNILEIGFWPAAGYRNNNSGILTSVNSVGFYWEAFRYTGTRACTFSFSNGSILLGYAGYRASGYAVRCVQE